jgi:NADH dehydrogenase/NADH:ubiquinone oxidoreductase subunit G
MVALLFIMLPIHATKETDVKRIAAVSAKAKINTQLTKEEKGTKNIKKTIFKKRKHQKKIKKEETVKIFGWRKTPPLADSMIGDTSQSETIFERD